MKHREISLISGALIGMAAMYFMDPQTGRRRRQAVHSRAEDAYRGASDALGDAWNHARSSGADVAAHAQDLADKLSDRACDTASTAAAELSDLPGKASDHAARHLSGLRDRVGHFAHDLADRARSATHPWRHKLAHSIDPDHDHSAAIGHTVGIAGMSVGTLAVGAAAMYLLDPAKGRERRQSVSTKLSNCIQETGHICQLAGAYVSRLWQRQAGAGDSFGEAINPINGELIVQRARAQVGDILANPASVQLMADSEGVLFVFGRVRQSEADSLMAVLSQVEGVRQVENRMEIAEDVPQDTTFPRTQPVL